ncbi:MAG: dihydroorotase [Cyclobacteriaceae bacterium]
MSTILILNATIVNEGKQFQSDVYIKDGRIDQLGNDLSNKNADQTIDASGKTLIPGLIDDQVHFREPGLTHKATIKTESRAAVAGGITSFMEMPNTVPQALTQELLEDKYQIAKQDSLANYSFFMGASNNNLDEVLKTDPKSVCGVKIFMGSSTGNMLVDNEAVLEDIFRNSPTLIATHCEDEATIKKNLETYQAKYGDDMPIKHHPYIRSEEACYLSSSKAIALAKKTNARLHILHISTEKETHLFDNSIPLKEKRITAEACAHHLWFSEEDYDTKGTFIKWNPAVKKATDRTGIQEAVKNNLIDVIATDHAPHTLEEKSGNYWNAPSGGPLVQHSLAALLELYHQGVFSLEMIVEKTSHAVATLFEIEKRGYIREGYWADLVLIDLNKPWIVDRSSVLSKCGWSPFEGQQFTSQILHTIV